MIEALDCEWQRVEHLCACIGDLRSGIDIPQQASDKLQYLQREVLTLRNQGLWSEFAQQHELSQLDLDILVLSIVPEVEPKVGWYFQSLQPGGNTHYPTPALMKELLFMSRSDGELLKQRLLPTAPLLRAGLITATQDDLFSPVKPGKKFQDFLNGQAKQFVVPHIPGAVHIQLAAGFDDLVISADCKRDLQDLVNWELKKSFVKQSWEANLRGGPVALFSGPSGTGKTFSAAVIANSLNYPLFRVDLGLLVSKYIGETEKNLNALFDAANGIEAVLLFDEADSLFGKRGEVKDARDRYANMEVSHLLSRIENHDGPCILTTNLRKHLDPAFARRFQVCVEFARPTGKERAVLWKKALPAKAPLALQVDAEQLGKELNLTGAQIKNCAIYAAFCAAAEESAIDLKHIARGVYVELSKEGKEVMDSSLGFLEGYLKC